MRWAAPVAVGLIAIVVWHTLVKAFNVPHYLVPSPALVVQTLIADWGLLFGSLLVTLKITLSGKGGSIVNVAQAYSTGGSSTPDPNLANNVASYSTTISKK
jgi:ABC-type nitrate/sulfonate/bicarbonate transport system permease component